ncbi:MAG: hypothetical protein AMXMBFR4_10870 [Candidatus Hydrogenedentota bacterium]
MIVKNEADCVEECLRSVSGIADQIVVGDTGSTDATVDMARRCGADVIFVSWNNDFAEARNAVLAAADGDWLLHLDADETVDPAGARRIRFLVDKDGINADAIELTLANYSEDTRAWRWVPARPNDPYARGKPGFIAVPLLRLFRNRKGYEYREPVHESITESVIEHKGRIRREPDLLIHHHGYSPADERKAAFYLEILRRKALLRPHDPKAWHDLAEQLVGMDRPLDAEEAARRALDLEPEHLGAATTLANILLNRGELDTARRVLEHLEQSGIQPPHVLTALAAIAIRTGDLERAIDRIERIAEQRYLMGHLTRARVLDVVGRESDALAVLRSAQEWAPGIQEIHERIRAHELRCEGTRQLAADQITAALQTLVHALESDPEDPLIHLALAHALDRIGETRRAEECRHRAYTLAPSLGQRPPRNRE